MRPKLYLIRDAEEAGGDGTFYSGSEDIDEMWSQDANASKLMTPEKVLEEIEDIDCARLLRHRLWILPADEFVKAR